MSPDPADGCSGGEVFALRVLGDSMAPEFLDGEIVIVEPDGAVHDGSFVLARLGGEPGGELSGELGGEWTLRQLARRGDGWVLRALHPGYPDHNLPGLAAIHGVIIQKAVPGKRRLSKRYV